MKEKIIFCWSTGKDSALSLCRILELAQYEVSCLLTTITEGYDRVGMHGVRRSLFKKQSQALGLISEEVLIPQDCSNGEYESRMQEKLLKYLERGVKKVAFGDIFLEDLRKYREANLAKIGMSGIFPLWRENSLTLAREFISRGFRAIVTCVDSQALGKEFCGAEFNEDFLAKLPESVDPCGENGEFHTFVFSGPILKNEVVFAKDEIVLRNNRFYYCDLK
jgi:uncharacterized protein (TIGR00290 family)